MGFPKVNSCCCGCTLQTGSKIIGYLGAIGALILCIFLGLGLAALPHGKTQDEQDAITVIRVILIIAVIICVISVIFHLLLIIGATSVKPGMLKAWIVYAWVALVISVISSLFQIYAQFKLGKSTEGVTQIISMIISIALSFYFIVVVSSYRKEIQGGR